MESQLQPMLRSLCVNTGWKYAIFWKLEHQEQMRVPLLVSGLNFKIFLYNKIAVTDSFRPVKGY